MALPFYLPGVDAAETELNYRRLERLLRDLYHVLHALIAGGAPLLGGRAANLPPPPPPPAAGSSFSAPRQSAGFTPPSWPPFPVSSSRTIPRGPAAAAAKPSSLSSHNSLAYWNGLGRELRLIADSLQDSRPRPSAWGARQRGAATA